MLLFLFIPLLKFDVLSLLDTLPLRKNILGRIKNCPTEQCLRNIGQNQANIKINFPKEITQKVMPSC
jgi:hypothetical protein